MNRQLPLTDLEKEVETLGLLIKRQKVDFSWLDDEEFHKFLEAWWKLAESYKAGDNTVINVDLVGNYLRWTRELEAVAKKAANIHRREQAATALNQLEGCMFEIQKEASRTLNNL
jgi:hypothetical protein